MSQRVAVVAVHGVADQEPASSARSIADLLCADGKKYTAFTEVPLRIEREPMIAGPLPPNADLPIEYMHDQLEHYTRDGAGAVYDTVRLEGKRRDTGADVHVYEVYWADLSRIGESAYRVFAELYQLLLHLPSLGRNAVEGACRANGGSALWRVASWLTARAVDVFTIGIPILNVVLLSLVLIALSAEIPEGGAQVVVVAGLPIVALLAGGAFVLSRRRVPRPVFYGLPVVIIGVVLVAARLSPSTYLYRIVAIEAAFASIVLCAYLASKYSVVKPPAFRFGMPLSIAASALAVYCLFEHPGTEAGVYAAAMNAAEYVSAAVVFGWMAVIVLALAAAAATWLAAQFNATDKRLAKRAAWSGRFGLAFPAALFATVTMAFWFLITKAIGTIVPKATYTPLDPLGNLDASYNYSDFLFAMVKSHAAGIEITAAGLVVFLLAAIWAAVPSVAQEVAPPKSHKTADGLGQWLSRGIVFVAAAGNLLTFALVLLAIIVVAELLFDWTPYDSSAFLVPLLSTLAAAIAAVLSTKNLTSSVRAAVDVLLDVDNYMRESPRDATPRARIAERYVSLLRHLCASGYDKIIIVAHSQGSVISADLLRYLQFVPDPKIKGVPIRLFTMGSPLRQLYAGAFPYLYSWIETPAPASPLAAPHIESDAPPAPASVNVEVWANAYRSGDYVGRHLWLNEETSRLWINDGRAKDSDGKRVQFCIGAGAHTHYWNRHGNDVAAYISELM